MSTNLHFLFSRLRERLWVKPLIACLLSVGGVVLAHAVDGIPIDWKVPEIAQGSVTELLKIIAASMLGVATFAVASMVSAYASTGQNATARAFPLIVADDVSQNALSMFVGAFIFSIVALSATTNGYFGKAGRFTLFLLTLLTLVAVIFEFVRWVDSIARLGRLGAVIAKVERATAHAMSLRKLQPCMGALAASGPPFGLALHAEATGYLQRIDVAALQRFAVENKVRISVAALPGAMILPSRPIAYVLPDSPDSGPIALAPLHRAFIVGPFRQFDEDPRFGLVVLAEIGSRALSPGINDPGTAIAVLSSLHRLFDDWSRAGECTPPEFDLVEVPSLRAIDMFEDAFPPIARDGAGIVEVGMRVQRVLGELGRCGDPQLTAAARQHALLARGRAELALRFPPDLLQLQRRHADYWIDAATEPDRSAY